jgi:hypothetical protein
MEKTAQPWQSAWQPLTPRGIAAFARAPTTRLLIAQLLVASVAAGIITWFVQTAWCPMVTEAIAQLPEQSEVRGGQLDWHGAAYQVLAENRFLALAVDLQHAGQARSPAQVQVEFGKADIQIRSLFGFTRMPYWRGWIVPCNRLELTPWWGAWRPPLLALLVLGVIVTLVLTWTLFASIYFLPAWLLGFFANRDLSLIGSWRLSGAALMPGALLMSAAIFLYRLGLLEVVGLSIAAVGHIVMGWWYILSSVLSVPRHPAVTSDNGNPFLQAGSDRASPTSAEGSSSKQSA